MADVEHSALTGSDLHEPKGVASATANQVYVADGAASGAWEDVLPQVAIYQYQETDGTDGDSYATSWTKLPLATEVSDPESIGSISSNQVTLGAGTWLLQGWAGVSFDGTGSNNSGRIRLYNATDATEIALGTSWFNNNLSGLLLPSTLHVYGQVVLAGSKAIELQGIASSTSVKLGDNDGLSAGVEVYAQLIAMKIKD